MIPKATAYFNPDRIYVENVRSFFNSSFDEALDTCELAVLNGVFTRHWGLMCPNGECQRVVASIPWCDKPPPILECLICESEDRPSEFRGDDAPRVAFYRLSEWVVKGQPDDSTQDSLGIITAASLEKFAKQLPRVAP